MTFLRKIKSHSKYSRFIDWAKLISVTGFAQILVQAIGFICGIIVIRVLSIEEYAIYTLANTMLGTMVVLSDGGISIGVMSEGAKVWQDKKKLGVVLATGFDLRKKFAFFSLVISIPILLYLLRNIGVSWFMSLIIVLVLIPAFISTLSSSILSKAATLNQDIIPLQKNSLVINFSRLALLFATVFIFPWAFIVILGSGISQIIGNIKLRKIIKPYVDLEQKPSIEVRREITKMVSRTLPESIYYCISGQITVWLLAFFGSTNSIAEIGALSRVAMLLNLVAIMFNTLIVPRFARLDNSFKPVFTRFIQIQILLILVLVTILLGSYLFANQILWLLGPKYDNFQTEMILALLGSALNLFSGITFHVCASKGWVINPLLSIPVSIIAIICCVLVLDVSTLYGVLILNIIIALVQIVMNTSFGFTKIFNLQKN